jgi:importin-5
MDIKSLLENLLSNENLIRHQAERYYQDYKNSNPSDLILSLLDAFKTASTQARMLAAVLLKQLVDPLSSKEVWSKMDSTSQNQFKSLMLATLRIESDQKSKELLCEVAGKLAAGIFSSNGEWLEVLEFIKSGLNSASPVTSLEILCTVYIYTWKSIPVTPLLFQGYLSSESIQIKYSSIKALNSILSIIKQKASQKYDEIIPFLLSSCFNILTNDQYLGSKVLEILREIVENKGSLFKQYLNLTYDFVSTILRQNLPTSIKLLAAEVMVSLYESVNDLDASLANNLIQDVFGLMVTGESPSDESWKVPEEGFSEDSSQIEIDYSKIGRKLINRIIESVGEELILAPTLEIIHEGLKADDWKANYSGIMTLGELIPFIAEPSKISDIIPIVSSACTSTNCKVRYAGYVLIVDLSINYIQEFQATYHQTIFPVILSGSHDPVPRVKAQALASMTAFIEGAGNKISTLYISNVPYLISLLHNQISLVIEFAVTSLSAFAKASKIKFIDYYQETVDELLALITRVNNRIYDNLRGRIIECISLISAAVGKQMFVTKIHLIIEAMTSFEVNTDHEVASYLLNSWQSICELLQEDFSEYLDNIVPYLLKFITSPSEDINVNTNEVINKEHALQTLCKFVETLKGKYWKYLDDTLRAALGLVNYTLNDNLRGTAAEILAGLVQAKKMVQDPLALTHAQELAKVFLSLLTQAAKEEFNKDTLASQLEAIGKILTVIGTPFLTQAEINQISDLSINILLEKSAKGYNPDDENIYIGITEVIGSIFKSHPYFTTHLLSSISGSVIPKLMLENKDKAFYKYVLYILDDAVEFLSASHPTSKWDEILSMLLCYATDPDDVLRQAAVYGLGVYAAGCTDFGEKAPIVLSALFCSLEIPSKRIETYGHAKDNSVSAISKIIKYQSQCIEIPTVIDKWIKYLPLRWDKAEANFTHELLGELLQWKPDLVIANNPENFLKVLQIISQIFQTKFVTPETVNKLKKFVCLYKNETESLFHRLTESQQDKIKALIAI